jgi:hypothetical protein
MSSSWDRTAQMSSSSGTNPLLDGMSRSTRDDQSEAQAELWAAIGILIRPWRGGSARRRAADRPARTAR